jgi:Domain of unknown function (DUF4389)
MTETPETPGAPEAPTGPPGGAQPPAPPPPAAPPTAVSPAADYPVHLDIDRQEDYSRFMPLIKWLLAIPHFLALIVLGIGAYIVIIISFFAVLFTGRYPQGMFDYMVGVHRWAMRVTGYVFLMVDPYPPFTLDDDPSYPVRFNIEYPEHVERWRPLLTWLLVIPYAIVAYLVFILAEIMVFFAFFTILFTRQYPEGLFNTAKVGLRWSARSNAYTYWMVTRYPPFVWD